MELGQIKKKKIDKSIAIAKCFGIIFIVSGHCCAMGGNGYQSIIQTEISNYIYLFHVPLFFMLSGYFFSTKYLNEKFIFVRKRITGLWLPYVKWTILFLVLHNTLYTNGFYANWKEQIPIYYNLHENLALVAKSFLFKANDQLIGGFWFIPVLFYCSIFSLTIVYLLKHSLKTLNYNLITIIAIITSLSLSVYLIESSTHLFFCMVLCASAIYLTGFLARNIELKSRYNKVIFLTTSTIVVIICSNLNPTNFLSLKQWYDVLILYGTGCLGTWTWVIISRYIAQSSKTKVINLLTYIGENTMIILALHFTCFKLINLAKIWFYNFTDIPFGSFPIVANDPSHNGIVWICLYVIVGVGIPIMIKCLSDKIRYKYFQS